MRIQEDDGYNPYSARDPHSMGMYDDDDRNSLVHNAVGMGMADKGVNSREDLEYQDPYGKNGQFAPPQKPESALQRFFGGRYPIEQRIENKKRGIGRQRHPFLGTCGRNPFLLKVIEPFYSLATHRDYGCCIHLRDRQK